MKAKNKKPLKVVVVNPPSEEEAKKKIAEINKFLNEKYNRSWNEK